MAAYEILLLNTAIPQIQAAQSGDTYVVPRDIAFSTVANLANGTNLLPSLTFSSDTNTGIYREGADALGFTAGGGTNQMVLTSTGLGVGTNNPTQKLQVAGNVAIADGGWYGFGDAEERIVGDNLGLLKFFTAGIERARISSDGTFRVKGAGTAGTTDAVQFSGSAPASAMTLDASGNLGVGTTSPINNSGYGGLSLNGTSGALFSLMTNGTESSRIASLGNETSVQCKATTGYITFVQGVTGGTERARITSGGNLEIANGNLVMSTSGKGIDFSATASGSGTMTSELLADYEEGTWTPVATAATGPTGVSYNFQGGWYRKIGSLVVAGFGINIANVGTGGSGELRISGLPFVSATNGSYREPTATLQSGRWVTAALAGQVYWYVNDGQTFAGTRYQNNADTEITWSDVQGGNGNTGTYFNGVISYYV